MIIEQHHDTAKPLDQTRKGSYLAIRLLIVLIAAIFMVEFGIMLLLHHVLPPLPRFVTGLIAGILLIIGLFPILYMSVFRSLFLEITERKRAEKELQKHIHDLDNQVKELNCLYGISKLVDKPNVSLEEILQGTIDLIPFSGQYPEITCARLRLEDLVFKTNNFQESTLKQVCDIIVHGCQKGTLEVFYLGEKPESKKGSFLKEKRSLINEIAERLGRIIEHKQAEEELGNTKEYLDNIIESSLDCIVVTDSTGCITRVNKFFLELIDYKEEEVIGKHISEFPLLKEGTYESITGELIQIDENYLSNVKTMVSRFIKNGEISNWKNYLIRKDKKVIPVEENIVLLYNDKGNISGAVGIIRDITERKKSEEEKVSIEGRLKDKVTELSIMNAISEVLLSTQELDEILHMILIGATAYQALGFNRAFLFLINEEGSLLEGKVATGSLSAEEAYSIWERLAQESHTLKELLKSRHGGLSKEDEPINNLVKQMKIPFRDSTSIFTQAIDEQKAFNIVNGRDNPLIDRDFIRLLGTDAFALVPLVSRGKPLGVLLADNFINREPIGDEDVERLRVFANHASLAIENSHLYKSSKEKVEELSLAYNELRENRDKLLRYERLSAVGNVAARVTHEIRNPLVAIGGFARRILKKDPDGKLNRNYVKIIVEEIDRLENTLTDILSFAKPAAPRCDTANLNKLIKNTLEVLGLEILRNNISVEEHFDPELPLLWLDENQIRRVVINLIRNAIQAMPDGGTITISTINEHQWVRVEIADTGVGISDEDMNKLFDAFFTSKSTGAGLGLTVSAQIINNHGGTIEAQKRKPKGTIFIIKLPVKVSSEPILT